jgi:hypothetical protein
MRESPPIIEPLGTGDLMPALLVDAAVLRRVRDVGALLLPGSPLQLFLLWENCD